MCPSTISSLSPVPSPFLQECNTIPLCSPTIEQLPPTTLMDVALDLPLQAARQLAEHHTCHSCPYTAVRLNTFGRVFGLAPDKLLDRCIAYIPLKSTASRMTLNTVFP